MKRARFSRTLTSSSAETAADIYNINEAPQVASNHRFTHRSKTFSCASDGTPSPLLMTVDPYKRVLNNQLYRQTHFFDIDVVDNAMSSSSSVSCTDKLLSFTVSGGAPVSTLQLPLYDSDDNSSSSWARQKLEDLLWLASALFILYYGDFHSNFFSLMAEDPRIRRTPLHAGLLCIFVLFSWGVVNGALLQQLLRLHQARPTSLMLIRANGSDSHYVSDGGSLMLPANGLQIPSIFAVAAFLWVSFALWPIWKILTLPMLFTLAMASVVFMSYVIPYLNLNVRVDSKL